MTLRPPTRRHLLKMTAGAALATPFLSIRASAQTVNLSMLAWYGHAEPDIVGAFEEGTTSSSRRNTIPAVTICWA